MEIRVPPVGESVFEALIAKWHKSDGEEVVKDEAVCEIETDKITMEIQAEAAGLLRVKVPEGTTVRIGAVIGSIEEEKAAAAKPAETGKKQADVGKKPPAEEAKPTQEGGSPAARKLAREKASVPEPGRGAGFTPDISAGSKQAEQPEGGETREEQSRVLSGEAVQRAAIDERVTRKRMTPIRKRISERLLAARQQTAMLTSFNEADLTRVTELRRKHGEQFQRKHGVKLGLMPFFVRACCEALAEFPAVNARIDGDDLVYHNFYDIGIAVSGEKGLVVPVLRDADRLRLAEIEQHIQGFTEKVGSNRLAISDLEGGTFTITNGGVFGSLLSTPILNPPQSAVLGMHMIQDRPVAREGQVIIRPMMYLALSYDHRIIDGREAVLFLKKVKEGIEEPEELLLEG